MVTTKSMRITFVLLVVAVIALIASTMALARKYGEQRQLTDNYREALSLSVSDMADTKAAVSELSAGNAELTDKNSELLLQYDELTKENENLRKQIEAFEPYMAANQTQIDELMERVQTLETELSYRQTEDIIAETNTMTKHKYQSDTASFQYWLYQPNYPENGDKQLPMIVSLHSGNGTGTNLDQLVNFDYGLCRDLYEGHVSPNAIILMPQSPTGWTKDYEALFELIDAVADEYNVDKSRIAITGVSRGGIATFEMLKRYDDYFFRAMPIASATDPESAAYIKTPLWIIHGELDTGMGFSVVEAERLITKHGGDCRLQMLPGVGHSGQQIYYEDPTALKWLTGT